MREVAGDYRINVGQAQWRIRADDAFGIAPCWKARRTDSNRTPLEPTQNMPDGSSCNGRSRTKDLKSSVGNIAACGL